MSELEFIDLLLNGVEGVDDDKMLRFVAMGLLQLVAKRIDSETMENTEMLVLHTPGGVITLSPKHAWFSEIEELIKNDQGEEVQLKRTEIH